MFIEHESPVGRISPKPVFEVGHPTLRALLDIRIMVAFGREERDLRSVHADKTGDDGNAEASANPRGPPGAMNALAENLSFNGVGSLGHNVSGSHDDLALSQRTHDVPRDGGGRYVSRQNVFWPVPANLADNFGAVQVYPTCRDPAFTRRLRSIFRFVKFRRLPLMVEVDFNFLITLRFLPKGV
jgi:hypothetical protein